MSSVRKIQKEDIIKAAFEILNTDGMEKVNARNIAKKLDSSVQPIFYQFKNMTELKEELHNYCMDYYQQLLLDTSADGPRYKEIGINYIKLARENPNVFKLIFMEDYHIKIDEFAYSDKSYGEVEQILQKQNHISMEKVKRLHLKMWMFTHGIACLIATGTCDFDDEEISKLLTEEFQALLNNEKK